MSIFTLKWFKSKLDPKTKDSKIKDQIIKNELQSSEKVYKKLKLVNDVLTVVLVNGEILTKSNCSISDFEKVKNSKSEYELMLIFKSSLNDNSYKEEILHLQFINDLSQSFELLEELEEFEISNESVKFKGINRTIPKLLLEKIIKVVSDIKIMTGENFKEVCLHDDEYLSLKRFFLWCCLNPRAEVAESLYEFLIKNSFRITKQGFFVALRNVVSLQSNHGDNQKIQFISNAYNKIKAVWRKKPENYTVYLTEDGEYKFTKNHVVSTPDFQKENHSVIGNLKDLYINLPDMTENRFTDEWTRTFDIRIGKIVSMPFNQCDWSTQDCAAAGLHFTADQIHYVGCGDTSVLMLINPMKVVGIGTHKGRCYEYLPIMTVPRDEATEILHDLEFDTIDLDEFYVDSQLESLLEKAQQSFAEEANKHEFNIPSISSMEIINIYEHLETMKNELEKRVQEVI